MRPGETDFEGAGPEAGLEVAASGHCQLEQLAEGAIHSMPFLLLHTASEWLGALGETQAQKLAVPPGLG